MIRSKHFLAEAFVSIAQAAEILGVSTHFVRQMIRQGTIAGAEERTVVSREALFRYKRRKERGRFHAYNVPGIRHMKKQELDAMLNFL